MRLMTGLKAAAADSTNTWAWLLSAAQPKFIAFSSSLERVRFALTFTTLRLNMPQWQGGDEPAYRFGSELLRWLAPPHDGPEESVEVPEADGNPPPVDHGIKWRDALLSQARARTEEHTSELQSLMRIAYAVFC